MKQLLGFLSIVLILSSSTNVFAEESGRHARRDAFWHLFGLPVYFFLEINVHEGSHALNALSMGLEVEGYYPYPHFYTADDDDRGFMFGRTRITWDERPSDNVLALNYLSPAISQISIFVISDLLISFVPNLDHSFFGPVLYLAGMVFPWFDFVFNLYNRDPRCDFAMAAGFLGERRELFYTIGTVIAAIGLWRLIQVFVKVFTETNEQRLSRNRDRGRGENTQARVQVNSLFGGLYISITM